MTWHCICRVGADDTYDPELSATEPRLVISFENPGNPHRMRQNLEDVFGNQIRSYPGSTATDFLHAAMAVFSADLCVPRSASPDRWTRDITVHLPVVDVDRWHDALSVFGDALEFLTGDRWSIRVRRREPIIKQTQDTASGLPARVCLFSGGLDSLAGAIDLLHDGDPVALVGHYGAGVTHPVQSSVLSGLQEHFGDAARGVLVYADPPEIAGAEREITRRARSIVFVGIGVAVADALSDRAPLYICENGLISLNVPLTAARSGSSSTRTTHPHFIELLRSTLHLLGLNHDLLLPYRFKTKGEMLAEAANPEAMAALTPLSMSCAHPESSRWEGGSPNTHCGYCYPCIIRRAATNAANIPDAPYEHDVVTETFDLGSKKARDRRAVLMALDRFRGAPPTRALFDVLNSGPIGPEHAAEFAAVYRRGMQELADLFGVSA